MYLYKIVCSICLAVFETHDGALLELSVKVGYSVIVLVVYTDGQHVGLNIYTISG